MIHGHHARKFYVFIVGVVFTAVMGGTLVYTFSRQRLYESTARIQFLPKEKGREAEDFNETVKIMESPLIARKVAGRLTTPPSWDTRPLNLQTVLSPYDFPAETSAAEVEKLVLSNRKIIAHPDTYIIAVQYRHPDRQVAAKIANFFADEYIAYNARKRIDESMRQVEALKIKAEQQEQKVKALEQALTSYRNAHPALTPETQEADPAYRALSIQFTSEDRVLKELINRMRDMTML